MHGEPYCVQSASVSLKRGMGFKKRERKDRKSLCAFLRDAKDNKSELRFHLGEAKRWWVGRWGVGEDGGGDKRQRRSLGLQSQGRYNRPAGRGQTQLAWEIHQKAQTQHGGSRRRQRGGALSRGCAKNTQRSALKLG